MVISFSNIKPTSSHHSPCSICVTGSPPPSSPAIPMAPSTSLSSPYYYYYHYYYYYFYYYYYYYFYFIFIIIIIISILKTIHNNNNDDDDEQVWSLEKGEEGDHLLRLEVQLKYHSSPITSLHISFVFINFPFVYCLAKRTIAFRDRKLMSGDQSGKVMVLHDDHPFL